MAFMADLRRADRLWLAIQHLKQELRLNQSPNEEARQRAHDLVDKYEAELFLILAKHDLNPKDYGYPAAT
jgi:hypothetical protein